MEQSSYFETDSLRETGGLIDRLIAQYERMGVAFESACDIAEFDGLADRIIRNFGQNPAAFYNMQYEM